MKLEEIDACRDEEDAYELFIRVRMGDKVLTCPQCKSKGLAGPYSYNSSGKLKERTSVASNFRFRCRTCKDTYLPQSGTVFQQVGRNLPLAPRLAILASISDAENQDEHRAWIAKTFRASLNLVLTTELQIAAALIDSEHKDADLVTNLLAGMKLPFPPAAVIARYKEDMTVVPTKEPARRKVSKATPPPEKRMMTLTQKGVPDDRFEWNVVVAAWGPDIPTYARDASALIKFLSRMAASGDAPTKTITIS